jgi:hypothetical protein
MSLTPMFDSGSKEEGMKSTEQSGHGKKVLWALLIAALLIGGGEGIYAVVLSQRLAKTEQALQMQMSKQDESVHQLATRLGMTEEQFANLQGDLTNTKTHLDKTQLDVRKAHQVADQLAKEQKETADAFTGQLTSLQDAQASTVGSVGALSTDVSGVKTDVSNTKQELASTRSDLQRVIGDLGVQSGLVAHNSTELAELKLRGERDYFEFDMRKTNQPQKFTGGVALQLKKTDIKRQKYTVDLISDDRRIEKKDKNTNEPVQFYQKGFRIPTEIVVNQIMKDRIVGYISVPKQREATKVSGLESNPPSRNGS